jgi:hypothetical protein
MKSLDLHPDPFVDLMAEPTEARPEDAVWLRYSYAGGGRTGVLHLDGTTTVLRDIGLDPLWFHVLALGNGRVAFYNNNSRLLTIGEVGADGGYADLRNNADVDMGHQVVRVFDDMLLSYTVRGGGTSPYRGTAVTGRVGTDGRYTVLSEPLLWDFWTHIVSVNDGLILFYNSYSRLATTGRVTGDGGYADLQNHPGFDPWTQIAAASDGTVLFYNTITGAAASGRVEADGGFTNLHSATLGPGWSFLPTRDGRMLVFRVSDTLVASFGASGWFSDARIVHGPILPRPRLFVR